MRAFCRPLPSQGVGGGTRTDGKDARLACWQHLAPCMRRGVRELPARSRNDALSLCARKNGRACFLWPMFCRGEPSEAEGRCGWPGGRWRDLPERLGDYETLKRRYYRWIEMGVLGDKGNRNALKLGLYLTVG